MCLSLIKLYVFLTGEIRATRPTREDAVLNRTERLCQRTLIHSLVLRSGDSLERVTIKVIMRHCMGGTRECHERFPIDQSSRGTTVGVRSSLHFMVEGVKGSNRRSETIAIACRVERFGGCCSVVVVVVSSRLLPFTPLTSPSLLRYITNPLALPSNRVKDRKIVDLSKVSYRIPF